MLAMATANQIIPQEHQDWFDIRDITLSLPRLSPAFHGYKIVQISDFHIGTSLDRSKLEETVAHVNSLQPDLVAITGDFVTFDPQAFVPDLVDTLSELTPKDATLAVLGNHDHWTDSRVVRSMLKDAGIVELNNEVYTLQRGMEFLHIAGVDDYMNKKARLKRVLHQLPRNGAAVLLAHEPDFADISAKSGRFDLQLSGHSHGGQVYLNSTGPLFLPRYARNYPAGLYQLNGMYLYTNRGLGTAEFKIRLNCRAEITCFMLNTC
jgi:predicted MPP superfamily phosphohydrolase